MSCVNAGSALRAGVRHKEGGFKGAERSAIL